MPLPKAVIHLLVPAPDGRITGSEQKRYRVACDPESGLPKHATGEAGSVTCPLCEETAEFAELKAQQGYGSSADRKAAAAIARRKAEKVAVSPESTDEGCVACEGG